MTLYGGKRGLLGQLRQRLRDAAAGQSKRSGKTTSARSSRTTLRGQCEAPQEEAHQKNHKRHHRRGRRAGPADYRPRRYPRSLSRPCALRPPALAGCGGGGEQSTSTPRRHRSRQSTATKTQAGQEHSKTPAQNARRTAETRQHTANGAPAPGTKTVAHGVPVTPGGDNSIQLFGAEGQTDQRAQAIADLTAYLSAFHAGQWARACASASKQFTQQLATMVAQARAKRGQEAQGLHRHPAAVLRQILQGRASAATQIGKVLSFRVRGDGYAYLIYKGAGGKVMFIAMADDGGEWKVNVPQPQAFQTGP